MVTVFLIGILYVSVAFYELVPVISEKQIKWFVIYGVLMTVSLVLSVLLYMGIRIPSPMEPITEAVLVVQRLLGGGK